MSDEWVCDNCGRDFDDGSGFNKHVEYCSILDTGSHIERYQRIREEIPDEYRETYEQVTGEGKSPKAFQAAVCYIESEVSQDTVEEAFDVTPVTIRKHVRRIIREGVVSLDYVQSNSPHSGSKVFNGKDGQCAGQEVKHGL